MRIVALSLVALSALNASVAIAQPAATLALKIDAAPSASYQMLCHVRAYKTANGVLANRYGVEKTGPYADTIPSPLATCQIKKTGGPGPVTVSLSKPGKTASATITAQGPAGQQPLNLF